MRTKTYVSATLAYGAMKAYTGSQAKDAFSLLDPDTKYFEVNVNGIGTAFVNENGFLYIPNNLGDFSTFEDLFSKQKPKSEIPKDPAERDAYYNSDELLIPTFSQYNIIAGIDDTNKVDDKVYNFSYISKESDEYKKIVNANSIGVVYSISIPSNTTQITKSELIENHNKSFSIPKDRIMENAGAYNGTIK